MDSIASSPEKQQLISSFLEIAVGQTAETATQFLQATSWQLEEAIQLFYIGHEGGGAAAAPVHAPTENRSSPTEDAMANESVAQGVDEDGVRAPLPVIRDVLYDDATFYRGLHPSPMVAFRNFEEEAKHPGVWETEENAASTASSSRDNLASLYRPPFELMHQGTFDKVKIEASLQDKWLLVNLQSTEEFSSHMLNRDTWANEAVAQTIRTNFIFWQVYHDTSEGKKVCTYYNLISIPAILVIDPITGQKMRGWSGMVQPERLLEDLLLYMERGPKEHHVVLPHKRPRENSQPSALNASDGKTIASKCPPLVPCTTPFDKTPDEDEELMRAIAASLENQNDAGIPSDASEIETNDEASHVDKPVYPPLPEEPKGDRSLLCRVGIRLPDGRRLQRSFLLSDPIELLWSFCCSELEEAKIRAFRFTQAIPGVSKSLDYGCKATFAESGLSNSMLSLVWE